MEFPLKTSKGKEYILDMPFPPTKENHYLTCKDKTNGAVVMSCNLNYISELVELYGALDDPAFKEMAQNAQITL